MDDDADLRKMLDELAAIDKKVAMHEKLLVLDAMTGQEAVNIAGEFATRVGFDGAILTKLDGSERFKSYDVDTGFIERQQKQLLGKDEFDQAR